jgi:SWI/SNF-related matrix-associated actin-dependent regulator of chromatin subfamily A-like protein 1
MDSIKYSRRVASITNEKIRISIPTRDSVWKELSDIPKVTYDGHSTWEIPLEMRFVERLKLLDFTFSKGLTVWYIKKKRKKRERKRLDITNIPELGGKLFHFQLQGVNYIDKQGGRALIADEMGLGKTVQALAWIQLRKEIALPVLVICPSFLKVNWMRETKKWTTGMNIQILSGQSPYQITENFVIINYDILSYWEIELKSYNFSTLIVDEAHLVKNNQAKRTKTFKKLSKGVPHLIALTGTPIENRPVEIYNIVYAIQPKLFPNYITFIIDFCDATQGRFGWDVSGASNTLQLNKILRESIMIRRKKKDVLKDLPQKQFVKVPLEISNREEYMKAETQFVSFMRKRLEGLDIDEMDKKEMNKLLKFAEEKEMNVEDGLTEELLEEIKEEKMEMVKKHGSFMAYEPLKQLAVEGKITGVVEWIKDFLDCGEKLVVFAYHIKTIDTLMSHFPDAARIDGGVSLKKRQQEMDKFQSDPNVKLFIGQIKAAGVGITLTAASNVAVIQYPWNPGVYFQACDRVHRISQMHQVTIWNLVGEDTIEEKIIEILIKKEKTIGEVTDGKRAETESMLSELNKIYKI